VSQQQQLEPRETTSPVVLRRAAVLGKPVQHSLSPVLHGAAYAALGLEGWHYDRHECGEAELAGFVAGLGPEWVGLSLTMPLKRVALDVADEVTPLAAAVGAANTLVLHGAAGGGVLADNTDVAGIIEALREIGVRRVERAVVLGAGGTAQAALAALRTLGETGPSVLVRDPARTTELRATAERLGVRPTIVGGVPDRPLPDADVVISTLPGGAADAYTGTAWAPGTVVMDVVYDPWPTPLAASAQAAGCRVVNGLDVLLHQAVDQVALMTGRAGPVEDMRTALAAALRARG
jgi:shikimate dehydrogenase